MLQTISGTPDPRSQIWVASDASSVSQATEKAAVRKSVCVYTFARLEIMRLTSKGFFAMKTKILSLPFYFIYHLTVSLLDRTSSKKTHYVSETFNLNVAVSGKLIIM